MTRRTMSPIAGRRLGLCRPDQRRRPGHELRPGALAGADGSDRLESIAAVAELHAEAGFRPGHVRRGGEPGLNRRGSTGRSSHRVKPAAPQIAISGSSGMWNRAETIVRAWKSVIAAAVAIVGSSRLRVAGTGQQAALPGRSRVSPRCGSAIGQHPRLGIRLVEEDEVAEPPQAEPRISPAGRPRGRPGHRRNRIRDRSGSETEPSSR